jgi:uncharacterized repeat protein (TIGR03803 family)
MFRYSSRAILLAALILFSLSAWSQYNVVYNFTPHNATPSTGLIADAQGNAYGATVAGGGNFRSGTVYEVSRATGYHLLYAFSRDGQGGDTPRGSLTFDSAGNLYGTASQGGKSGGICGANGCGVVFELSPPASGEGGWTETVLYTFCQQKKCNDGATPMSGVIFDSAGNLYGTTEYGGVGAGTVFKLSPNSGGWTERTIYDFNGVDGEYPIGGLVFDTSGNLYGTTSTGTGSAGIVFELSPSGPAWAETILHTFGSTHDGAAPESALVFDNAGNLYGTTGSGGELNCAGSGCGTVFEVMPTAGEGWTENVIHSFNGVDGQDPLASVVLDAAGNVYGTTFSGGKTDCGGNGCGTVFRLTPESNGQWRGSFFSLPGGEGGENPTTPLLLDSSGHAYGTAANGGENSAGVMFEIRQ